jgi:hypothetical protein
MVFSFRVWLARDCASEGNHETRLRVFSRQPAPRCLQRSEKQSRLRAYQRNAICLFGGAVDGKSGRVIVFPSLAPMAFRVQPENGNESIQGHAPHGNVAEFDEDGHKALTGGTVVPVAKGKPRLRAWGQDGVLTARHWARTTGRFGGARWLHAAVFTFRISCKDAAHCDETA